MPLCSGVSLTEPALTTKRSSTWVWGRSFSRMKYWRPLSKVPWWMALFIGRFSGTSEMDEAVSQGGAGALAGVGVGVGCGCVGGGVAGGGDSGG